MKKCKCNYERLTQKLKNATPFLTVIHLALSICIFPMYSFFLRFARTEIYMSFHTFRILFINSFQLLFFPEKKFLTKIANEFELWKDMLKSKSAIQLFDQFIQLALWFWPMLEILPQQLCILLLHNGLNKGIHKMQAFECEAVPAIHGTLFPAANCFVAQLLQLAQSQWPRFQSTAMAHVKGALHVSATLMLLLNHLWDFREVSIILDNVASALLPLFYLVKVFFVLFVQIQAVSIEMD